jgi:hypothetical protein
MFFSFIPSNIYFLSTSSYICLCLLIFFLPASFPSSFSFFCILPWYIVYFILSISRIVVMWINKSDHTIWITLPHLKVVQIHSKPCSWLPYTYRIVTICPLRKQFYQRFAAVVFRLSFLHIMKARFCSTIFLRVLQQIVKFQLSSDFY